MKVWKITGDSQIKLEDLGPSQVVENCVKVKVLSASLSMSDKIAYEGKFDPKLYPIVPGRCGAGIVSETDPSVKSFKRGNRVYLSSKVACNECFFCKTGRRSECAHLQTYGKDIDGVLSDFAIVPVETMYHLPDRVSDIEAVFIEHVAIAINTINTLKVERGDHFAIVGASALGLILAQVALYYQAVPVVIDNREDRLEMARELGIYYTINSAKEDVEKRVSSLTGGKKATRLAYTLDSSALSYDKVLSIVSNYGKAGFVGSDVELGKIRLDVQEMVEKSITLYGINQTTDNITSAINMLASKDVKVANFITEIPFTAVPEYLTKLKNGEDFIQLVVKGK
ncbi:MAG: alcohol dehydrogenase catalytic domain-containing protein [Clostridia bacterium]|nr:alcohol dehydrogenase catalytic domain-containing protein [Clostridia bacterium]